jgi:hypothetical protein
MAVSQGNFAMGGGDPRVRDAGLEQSNYIRPQMRKLHDHTVTFEEYHYYANLTREREERLFAESRPTEKTGILAVIFPSKSYKAPPTHDAPLPAVDEKDGLDSENSTGMDKGTHLAISDEEWVNASRALRTATWSAVFYLITTDILGPFGVP